VADIFQRRNERSVFMTIDIEGIFLNCHFFTEEEIEFDLDPGEVNGEEKLEQLFKFMQLIGALLQKEVILTPENMQEIAIFSYKPGTGKIEFMPFGGWQ
jgi:hypothetical protein